MLAGLFVRLYMEINRKGALSPFFDLTWLIIGFYAQF